MKYIIFCEDCKKETEVSCPMSEFGEDFLKKIKCEHCKGKMKKLIANVNYAMTGFKTDSKRTEKASKKMKQKQDKKIHERKIHQDPYYGLRDK